MILETVDMEEFETIDWEAFSRMEQASIIEEFFNSRRIYSGDWDMRSQSEYGKHDKRKCYLLPQLRNLENVRKG